MSCYNGTNFKKRQVGFCGDKEKGIPSSINYITNIAQRFADAEQTNIVIYERISGIKGRFYDFEPQSNGREIVTKLIKFNRKDKGKDVLQDNGDGESKSVKSKKSKGKSRKAK